MTTTCKISEWFYAYNKDVYHFLLYYIGSGDIDDLVQEVYIKAIKGMDSFKGQSSPKTWLISIARNVGIDELRKRKRDRLKKEAAITYYETVEEKPADVFYYLNESNQHLYRVIHSLKDNYRDVIILRAIKEFSIAESAEVLNWSESKVRSTYHRALKALENKKEDLKDERERTF